MTKRKALTFIVHAPALVGKDGRTLDVVRGMEKALPGLRLEWRLSEVGRPIALPQRDAWLVENIEDGGFPLVCNGDERYPVTSAQAVRTSLKCMQNCHWYGYGSEVAQQFRRSPHGPALSPRGLPMLNLPEKLPAPEIPCFLGWLNYWSAAAANVIGFPDPARDAKMLSRARRTPSGGWVVQLTDAPLDYDHPAHLDALKRAHERFPEVGGRAVERQQN